MRVLIDFDRNIIFSLLLLIGVVISQFYLQLNILPALVILILAISGSLNSEKSLKWSLALVLVLLLDEDQGFYNYLIKCAYIIIPFVIGYFISRKFKHTKSLYFAIIAFIVPLIAFIDLESQSLKLILSAISYLVLHMLYFKGIKENDRVYFYSFIGMLIIWFIDHIIGYYLNTFSNSLLLSFLLVLLNLSILTILFKYVRKSQTLIFASILYFTLIITFGFYFLVSYNKSSNYSKNKDVVRIKNDIKELHLFTNGIENKIVIYEEEITLNFWATWCGPCIRKFNTMKKINDNEFYISFEDSLVVEEFIKKKNYSFPIYYTPKQGLKNLADEIYIFPSKAIFKNDSVLILKGK